MASGSQNNTSYQAQKWTNLRAFTIGDTNKDIDGTSNMSWNKDEILGASTDAYFLRGDKAWSNTLNNTFTANGNIIANNGYLKSTANENTVQIGSQNSGFCHITNTAAIPFWFNQGILMERGKTIGAAGTVYCPFQIYLGRNTTSGSNSLNANSPLIEFSNSDRSQYCQLIYDDYDSLCLPDSLTLVGNQNGITFICKNGPIWVQGGSNAGGNINRLTTSSGMPGNMQYNTSRRGTQIYSNGIAFADPYNGNSNSDAGWIRHQETTSNAGELEIAVGDDGDETIVVRQYNTSNGIKRTLTLLSKDGYTLLPSYLNLGGGHEKNASSPTYVWGSNSSDNYLRSYQTSHLNVATASKVGEAASWLYFHHSNEVNFGGTNTSTTIFYGYRATDSRGKPTIHVFGSGEGTATVKAAKFQTGGNTAAIYQADRCNVTATNGTVGIHSATNRGLYEFTDNKWIIYLQHSNDTVHSGYKIYNAVWNDFAEMREGDITEGGYAVYDDGHGHMKLCTERLQPGARLTSDTFGIAVGHTEMAKTPIGVAGRVLVYPAQDRINYKVGDAVCAAPGGKVDLMTREEIMMYPERILGTVSEIPDYEIWNQRYKAEEEKEYTETNIEVKGRIWVYVR